MEMVNGSTSSAEMVSTGHPGLLDDLRDGFMRQILS
jgi:hypothetical protein